MLNTCYPYTGLGFLRACKSDGGTFLPPPSLIKFDPENLGQRNLAG